MMHLFILLTHVAMVMAVPGCHSDRDKDHQPRENCTATGFSDVPAGFKPTTKVLLFPRNLFSSLSWASFQVFTEIYEIDLTGNQVPEVTPSAVPVLPSLRVLHLGWNRLTSLPDHSFTACPSLTKLYLDNNAIDSLSDHAFSALSKLKILDLSSNRIRVLPSLMLHPLPAIETLYLENNKIAVMPDDWFGQKEEVPYLFLSANPWACYCDLTYLSHYLDSYDYNVYVRDGPILHNNGESVVCDSPEEHRGKPVISLEESDLCPESDSSEGFLLTQTYSHDDGGTTLPLLPATTAPMSPPASTRASTAPAAVTRLHTESAVTWSWQQTFTSLIEWDHHSGSEVRGDGGPPVPPTAESVAKATPSTGGTSPPATTSPVPTSTLGVLTTSPVPTSTLGVLTTSPVPTSTLGVLTTTFAAEATSILAPSTAITPPDAGQRRGAIMGTSVFCFWLFAGCVLLCTASGVCTLVTMVRLVFWSRNMVRKRRGRRGGEGAKLLMYSLRDKEEEQEEVAAGGAMALYRSVLFVYREGGGDGGSTEGQGGRGGEQVHISLEPAGGATTSEGGGGDKGREKGAYKKTIYRVLNRQEEVTEESQLAAGGGRGGAGPRKRYSIILREEREEAGEQKEALDWVVGGWEVTGGGRRWEEGEPRSSWGEWLTHYLPSMPWIVTTPSEGGAAK